MEKMEKTACSSCGYQNGEKTYFCKKCGRFLLSADFGDANAVAGMEFKLKRIAVNLEENPHIEIPWNDAVDAYAHKVERIESLLRLDDLGVQKGELMQKVDAFLQMCRNPDFEIALVGAVKAGKSTLVNALLGKNYASTDPNPETAVLTKFRSSEKDYVRVKFYSEKEWERLWKSVQKDAEKFKQLYRELDAGKHKEEWIGHADRYVELPNSEIEEELKKWSSSHSPVHFFVKEIEVGISILPKEFPKQVVFVDTPGLFDPVAFRSQVSVDYIQSANAVLVCVKAGDLHGEEVKTVESVFSFSGNKQEKVFIIATNWDKLNNVVEDWDKRLRYMVDSFTGKAFYPSQKMAADNIMYADSYHYNLCREYDALSRGEKREIDIFLMKLQTSVEIAKDKGDTVPGRLDGLMDLEMGPLSQEALKKLMDATNIQNVNKKINTQIVSQYEDLLLGDITNLYNDIMYMTKRIAGERKNMLEERITISRADLKQIEEKLEETKRNRDEFQRRKKQLEAALGSLDKITQKRLTQILSRLEQSV